MNLGTIRRFGRTQAGTQRSPWRTGHGTGGAPIGTVFDGRHHPQETIIECLALLAERNRVAAIQRVKGVQEEPVVAWLRLAAQHVERSAAILLANYRLTRAQLDAMWTSVGHTGEKGGVRRQMTAAPSGAA